MKGYLYSVLCPHPCNKGKFPFRISWIVESGMLQRWMKTHWPKDKCIKYSSPIHQHHTDIPETSGAFIVLGVGVGFSILTFILELIFHSFIQPLRKKWEIATLNK